MQLVHPILKWINFTISFASTVTLLIGICLDHFVITTILFISLIKFQIIWISVFPHHVLNPVLMKEHQYNLPKATQYIQRIVPKTWNKSHPSTVHVHLLVAYVNDSILIVKKLPSWVLIYQWTCKKDKQQQFKSEVQNVSPHFVVRNREEKPNQVQPL